MKLGFENFAPRTSEEFARCWSKSSEREALLLQIEQYNLRHPPEGDDHEHFALSRKMEKSKQQRENSPYTLSYWRQMTLCMWREFQRIKNDPSKYILTSLRLYPAVSIQLANVIRRSYRDGYCEPVRGSHPCQCILQSWVRHLDFLLPRRCRIHDCPTECAWFNSMCWSFTKSSVLSHLSMSGELH
jgi:hypothetical protein